MKKNYQKPAMRVVQLQHQPHLLSGSVQATESNVGFRYAGSDADFDEDAR